MAYRRSKEDDVNKISTSIFVTNFPDQFYAKDLWKACNQYGSVVDAFIPNRRSKAGKSKKFAQRILSTSIIFLIKSKTTIMKNDDVVIMGDFNEVRTQEERYGSIFNVQGANAFNSFISNAGLEESILMREAQFDYGPIPFRLNHYDDGLEVENANKLNYEDAAADSEVEEVSKTIFEKEKSQDHKMDDCNIRQSEIRSEDPFNIYNLFNKKQDNNNEVEAHRLQLNIDFPNKLNIDQQIDVEYEVSRDEIKRVVWDCGTDKSPGPDRFTFGFYRHYWSFLDKDVEQAVRYFFHHGTFSKAGSLYKIIAKILANRLMDVLRDNVNEVQSDFVANKQILDGPFILNELYHWCKKKKKQTMIFKVDFEKAYDSVRWDYLDEVLKNFGFGDRWRRWIQSCLIS
nr:cysteine-rich receptor-like protein kinase [Tanacetum cinerariifolium]